MNYTNSLYFIPRSNSFRRVSATRLFSTVFVLAVMVSLIGTHELRANESVIRIDLSSKSHEERSLLFQTHPDILAAGNTWIDVLVSEQEIAGMEAMDLNYEFLIHDAHEYESELRDRSYFDHFHDYMEIVDELEAVIQQYPDIVELHDIGDSWEKTQNIADRDIWALKISDNVHEFEREEPEVLLMSNLHAREIITPEIAVFMIHYLTENYGSDPRVTQLVDERQIWIIPSCNPDGLDYVHHQDIWWRKNRRDNGDGTYGVDLNRNWGYAWGYDDEGSSPFTWSETYRGTGPFSEPETQVLRDFTEAHNFIISLSYHSYGNWWLYPWGYIPENTPDHPTFVTIGDSCAAYNGYEPGNSASGTIYPTNGDSDDWLYGEQTTKYKIFAFTPEVGSYSDGGFHPDTTLIDELIFENLGPNLYVIDAGEEYSPRPIIEHVPLTDTEDYEGPYIVTASITSELWPLDTTTARLYYSWGDNEFQSIQMNATGNPDEYEAHIPGFGEPDTCRYYISAADDIPRIGYAPEGAPDMTFMFYAGPDQVPPNFQEISQLQSIMVIDAPRSVHVHVSDNLGIDLNSGVLHFIAGDATGSVPMVVEEWIGDTAVLSGLLGEVGEPGDTVHYYCTVYDSATEPNIGFSDTLEYVFGFEDFENGLDIWDTGDGWDLVQSGSSHSGEWMVTDSPTGNYGNNEDNALTLQSWIHAESFDNLRISFWAKWRFQEEHDFLHTEISTDGIQWETIDSITGTELSWTYRDIQLNDYYSDVDSILIRFRLVSDGEETSSGAFLDDIFVEVDPTLHAPHDQPPLVSTFIVGPNPATSQAVFSRTGDLRPDELLIYDISGRLIRSTSVGKGQQSIRWDLKDSDQERISSGVYFARLKKSALRTKLIVLK